MGFVDTNLCSRRKKGIETVFQLCFQAWKTLLRQLMLRGYLLRETLNFYRLANQHEELSAHVAREMVGGNTEKIGQLINREYI